MAINFEIDVGNLSNKRKIIFYSLSANYLTTCIRDILENQEIDSAEKLDQLKYINVVSHRLLNRLFDLQTESNSWNESDIWNMVKDAVKSKTEIRDYVGNAISHGLNGANNNLM